MSLSTPSYNIAIGIDLAWTAHKESGVCIAFQPVGEPSAPFQVKSLHCVTGLSAILSLIDCVCEQAGANGRIAIAVDAPLIVGNQGMQRDTELCVSRLFWKHDAGPRSSNNSEKFKAQYKPDTAVTFEDGDTLMIQLERLLRKMSFRHFPESPCSKRIIGEVYPHPASVVLFELKKIEKYKKGTLDFRLGELTKQRGHLMKLNNNNGNGLFKFDDKLIALPEINGRAFKNYEDRIDALLCAFLAAMMLKKSEELVSFGSIKDGYITVPSKPFHGLEVPSESPVYNLIDRLNKLNKDKSDDGCVSLDKL